MSVVSGIKPGAIIIIAILFGCLLGAGFYTGIIPMPGKTASQSTTLEKTQIQKIEKNTTVKSNVNVQLPGRMPSSLNVPEYTIMVAAWNSQFSLLLANGGIETTEGSLMEKNGVRLRIIRDDNYAHMQQKLVNFARNYRNGYDQCDDCIQLAAYMGDGAPSFHAATDSLLRKELGPQYVLKGFASAGYSRGEDKFMGLPEWRSNPQSARGSLVAVVLRDGDFNIILKWAAENDVPVNPDETTYDPDAINFLAADDFIHAAKLFIAAQPVTRKVVKNGRYTGKEFTIVPNGVSTWLPGDEMVVNQRGGVITIASTKEYAGQMPNFIVGVDKFLNDHPDFCKGIIKAIDEATEIIKASPEARRRAGEISAQVYGGVETPEYWEKYYDGEVVTVNINGQNYQVELGGSSVNNLGDMMLLFGLIPGSMNVYAATYNYFGKLYQKMYPQYLPTFPPVDDVLNLSFLKAVSQEQGARIQPTLPKFTQGASHAGGQLSKEIWTIEFASNSADLTPAGRVKVRDLAQSLSMTMFSSVAIVGYTDSVNTAEYNLTLSKKRSYATALELNSLAPVNYPMNKFDIQGMGEANPVADNSTADGRARNRRVEIIVYR